jgi:RNA polymerase sigma-70 factor (ECF subfamily)
VPSPTPTEVETTAALLARVREGDRRARDQLLRRYLPILLRWGHRRLPARARDLADTQDLVHRALLKGLDRVTSFEPRHEGAFLAYLRAILLNEVRGEIRRTARHPAREPLSDDLVESGPSPIEQAIGRAALDAYEAALAGLRDEEREAVILRIEMGFSHRQVAEALGKPSADAARMLVARATVRLAEAMNV